MLPAHQNLPREFSSLQNSVVLHDSSEVSLYHHPIPYSVYCKLFVDERQNMYILALEQSSLYIQELLP